MAFPTTGVIDAYNRADGTASFTSGGWTQQIKGANSGTLQINTNQLAVSTNGTGESSSAYYSTATYGPDFEVFCTVPVKPGNGNPTQLFGRLQSPGTSTFNGYMVQHWADVATDFFDVSRITSGTATVLGATISQEMTAGDSFGFSMVGSTIEVWYRAGAGAWTSMGTRTDTTYTSAGNLGVGLFFGTVRVDDFGGGSIFSAVLPAPLLITLNRFGGKLPFLKTVPPSVPVSSASFAQALTATTVAVTASMVRSVGKLVSASNVAVTASIVKSVGKLVSATATTSASATKSVGKLLSSSTVNLSASIVKSVGKILTATSVSLSASMVRSVGKIITRTTNLSATMVRSVGKTLVATNVVVSASLVASRAVLVTLTATVVTTASMVRSVAKTLTATATTSASIVKSVTKTLSVSVISSASMVAAKVAGGVIAFYRMMTGMGN